MDSSVEGERAGGAGGGASRPTPVAVGDSIRGVGRVSDVNKMCNMKKSSKSDVLFYHN